MTFSIVAFDPPSGDLGIAVQSKFPNAGVAIPYARAGVGAVATQAYCNTGFGPRGLQLLANGASPRQALEILVDGDPQREFRQVGIVDAQGRAAAYTGGRCFDWCGSVQGTGYSAQGNALAGAGVVEAMGETVLGTSGPLAERLLLALEAGQAAGGERRGQQSTGLLVVRAGGGYGGFDDRLVEISVYDHPTPIAELRRLYGIHRLTYLRSDPADLIPIRGELARELRALLHTRGFPAGAGEDAFDTADLRALHDFMGWENYDERIRDDGLIDREVLDDMRTKHRAWLQANQKV
jgi:uncharacterized Ntn-hydrolase superfamily protein